MNASALAAVVDTETNWDEMVISATSPGGSGTAVAAGVLGAAALAESSFFFLNRPPSLPATAPASALGLLGLASESSPPLEPDWLWCALEFLHCAPPMASVNPVLTG